MNKRKSVKCVIFDCDGTLIDSEKLCIQAQVDILDSAGIQVEYDWLKKNYQGMKIDYILSSLIDNETLLEGEGLKQLISRYRVRCNQLFTEFLTPIDGVREVLESLLQNQIAICIASNAPLEKMEVTLPLTDLYHFFEGRIFSAFDANVWKPDPGLIHYVMDKMSVSSDECLFIDDSLVGVEAGVKAGVKTLYFAHATHEDEAFEEGDQLYKVTQLKDLLSFI
ncbi:HAD-IA family hydrolase [Vibrio sp. JC009]|uniref:HAD-IA family hydrolase n=1 Tax=Vibrio sp. JC009 TaxID=2912314 RepID=UPI0023AFBFC1|nr:HAD-IA family hydrolase [Vibrio sp. JC009]WED24232.1 HAD-IA family hydrolase [Vibrio sp. JC009]